MPHATRTTVGAAGLTAAVSTAVLALALLPAALGLPADRADAALAAGSPASPRGVEPAMADTATPAAAETAAAHAADRARARFQAGDIAAARDLLQQAWDAHRTAGTDTTGAALTTLFDLGAAHLRLGSLGPARRAFARAAAGFAARTPGDDLAHALALEGLAAALVAQENTAAAARALDRARALRRPHFGPEHPQMLRLDALEARLARLDGRLDQALAAMERAKEGYRRIHGNLHPTVAAVVRNFTDLYLEVGKPYEARIMAEQADTITRLVYGAGSPERVAALASRSRVAWHLDRPDRAERFARQARDLLRRHGRAAPVTVAACELGLARAHLLRGEAAAARAPLRRAARAYERAWWQAGGALERATFMASPYPLLAAAELLAAGETPAGEASPAGASPDAAQAAWQALEQHQGRTLRHARRLRLLTDTERARRDSLLQHAVTLAHRIDGLAVGGAPARLAALRTETTEVDAALRELDHRLQARLARQEGADRAADPAAVARRLRSDAVMVGWLDAPIRPDSLASWAWVLTPDGALRWVRIRPEDAGRDLVAEYRSLLAGEPGPAAATAPRLRELARRLFDWRLGPLLPWLEDARHVVVVPGSSLAGVPLATLITPDGRPVNDRWTVTVAPRADLAPADPSWPAARRLLAVADPPFRPAHAAAMRRGEVARAAGAGAGPTRYALAGAVRGDARRLQDLVRLPATREEVAGVARFFAHAELLVGEDAREDRLRARQRQGQLRGYDVIHVATHALVDATRPERSALVLSLVAPPTDDDARTLGDTTDDTADGLLTAAEIAAGWRLDADLVTLSACETGLGRPAPGEGYLGFTQAFLAAGARNVLVSLWQVDDHATALLMERFYANLQHHGHDLPTALQRAQTWLRQHEVGGRRPYAAPRFWGAFVLVGSG